MSRNYASVIASDRFRRSAAASITEVDFSRQQSRSIIDWNRKNSVANRNTAQTADQKHAKTCGTIFRVVGGVLGGLFALSLVAVFVVPYTLSELAKVNKSYQETCGNDVKCNQSQLLECPTVNGGCNCPVYSTTKKCDCKIGYFWDYDKKTCTKRKAYGELCINQTDYQCALNTTLVCTGTCSCPTTDYLNGTECIKKKALFEKCLIAGPSDQCASIYVCDANGVCNCPTTHYLNGAVCTIKKVYQVSCASNTECDNNKNLECPINSTPCNCPTLSSANKCDCPIAYYWDSSSETCVQRRQYGESCKSGSDFQCVANKNFICDGTCKCSLAFQWTGTVCGKLNLTYQETCDSVNKCDTKKLLDCATVNGGCNCPVSSTINKCDCSTGYFWDYVNSACTKRKAYGETCLNQTTYQCALNTPFICTGTCSCPTTDYWNGTACVKKKALFESCLLTGPSDQCESIYVCDANGVCNCPNTHYLNGAVCTTKKLYQVTCASNSECDDNKNLECPVNAGLCNCPTISSSFNCDCPIDYYWDSVLVSCVKRRKYGESCTNGSDFQCDANKNFICNGVCTCPLVLRWTGTFCDLDLFRFFTFTRSKISVLRCGNVLNGRSIEPKNGINYVLDVGNNQVALYDSNWKCDSVQSVSQPRFMKAIDNDIYMSSDVGLIKMDSDFNTLIPLSTAAYYKRLSYDETNDRILANNYFTKKIDTYDRNLNLIDSLDLRALGYLQSTSGLLWHNGSWYIGTEKSQVLIIRNKAIVSVYNNVCVSTTSPVNTFVDNYGNMAVACYDDRKIFLYGINGTYLNLHLNNTSPSNYVGYDSKGRLVSTGGGTIDIYA